MKPTSTAKRKPVKPEPIHVTLLKEMVLKFPDLPNHATARKFLNDYPQFMLNHEQVRGLVKNLKGANGEHHRNKSHVEFRKQLAALKKELPKGETEKKEPYHLPKSIRRVLLLSDIHIPYHNDEALFAALEFGHEKNIDCIYLNGDTMDQYQLSRHEKDPRRRDFRYELDCTRAFLKGLRKMFPNALIIYKIGNHDARYEKWMLQNSAIVFDEQYMSLGSLLGFTELRIYQVDSKQFAYAGKLPILHGHELPMKSGGDNPANLSKKRMGKQAIFGHFHKTTVANGREFDKGMSYHIYSTGCLCDLYPDYMPINEWNHGFAYIELNPSGEYRVENKTIINGTIY